MDITTSGFLAWGRPAGSHSRDYLGGANTMDLLVTRLSRMDLSMYRAEDASVVIEDYRDRKLVERYELTENGQLTRIIPTNELVSPFGGHA